MPPSRPAIPRLYATENVPTADKVICAHYFLAGCDWWVVELDREQALAFGYVCLNDPANAEWGYISLEELEAVNVPPYGQPVERDCHWSLTTVAEAGLPGRP